MDCEFSVLKDLTTEKKLDLFKFIRFSIFKYQPKTYCFNMSLQKKVGDNNSARNFRKEFGEMLILPKRFFKM